MIILGSFWEGIIGFLGFIFVAYIVAILISLIGRLTNTSYLTKGGTQIKPFMTPKESREERINIEKERELLNWSKNRNKELNEFCREFGTQNYIENEDKFSKMARIEFEKLSFGSNLGDSLGILSSAAEEIEEKGNSDFVLDNYKSIKKSRIKGEINNEQYIILK